MPAIDATRNVVNEGSAGRSQSPAQAVSGR
jgi:hypothetical protein